MISSTDVRFWISRYWFGDAQSRESLFFSWKHLNNLTPFVHLDLTTNSLSILFNEKAYESPLRCTIEYAIK